MRILTDHRKNVNGSSSRDAGWPVRLESFVSIRISDEAIRGATGTHSITGLCEK